MPGQYGFNTSSESHTDLIRVWKNHTDLIRKSLSACRDNTESKKKFPSDLPETVCKQSLVMRVGRVGSMAVCSSLLAEKT